MPKKHDKPLKRVHVNLEQDQIDKIEAYFPHSSVSGVLRQLVARFLSKIEDARKEEHK